MTKRRARVNSVLPSSLLPSRALPNRMVARWRVVVRRLAPQRLAPQRLATVMVVLVAFLHHAAAQPAAAGSAKAPTTPAPPAGKEQSANEIYAAAQRHYMAHRYTEALPLFRKLAKEQDSPNARLYVARSLREVGRLPEAYEEMKATVADAGSRAKAEPRFAATRSAAQKELEQLNKQVGFVTLQLPGKLHGLVVEINGVPVPSNRFSEKTAVMPGTVRIRADAPGFVGYRQEPLVAAGQTETVAIALTPKVKSRPVVPPPAPPPTPTPSAAPPPRPTPTAAPAPPSPAVEPPAASLPTPPEEPDEPAAPKRRGKGLLVGGIVTVGLAALCGVGFGVTRKMAGDKYDEVDEACGGTRCPDDRYDDDIDTGEALDIASHASLGAGVLALLGGGVLITIHMVRDDGPEPGASSEPPQTGTLELLPVPGGGLLAYGMALPF